MVSPAGHSSGDSDLGARVFTTRTDMEGSRGWTCCTYCHAPRQKVLCYCAAGHLTDDCLQGPNTTSRLVGRFPCTGSFYPSVSGGAQPLTGMTPIRQVLDYHSRVFGDRRLVNTGLPSRYTPAKVDGGLDQTARGVYLHACLIIHGSCGLGNLLCRDRLCKPYKTAYF